MDEIIEIRNGLGEGLGQNIPYGYPCETQPTIQNKTYKLHPNEINLGLENKIWRWHAGSILKWVVDYDSFTTPSDASYAEDQFVKATDAYNKMSLGVNFLHVDDPTSAVFTLEYAGDNGDALVDAFFPNSKRSNHIYVCSSALKDDARKYLDNIFQHELGHVLGLRHEFAAEQGDFELFGEKNPCSVMLHRWPPRITTEDIKATQDFYAWREPEIGTEINTYKIVDVFPMGGK